MSDSFTRGYGVFETLRTYENKALPFLDQHVTRLFSSAKKINLPIKYSQQELAKMLIKITQKSPHKIQRLKIIAILEGVIIFSEKLTLDKKIYQGVSCQTIVCERGLPEIKSISYLPSYLSHEQAAKNNYYDAILTDENNEVYEAAYSNIFWFEGNTLCTRADKVLPGIIRETILKISPYKIKFKTIKVKDLLTKKEIFLTSSLKGIVPVTKINNKKIGSAQPSPQTQNLMKLLQHHVQHASSSAKV